ncbi:hypothetical protein [Streptomyces sp. NRRL S-31]|uniref:hypothetical protein n=1 Tax=Streptomyces sp. NRRL S-31 TaxID=1463898 RepID=UPI0020A6AA95|nr:hypothetical protein [Streptomyces sp. NRRL S-31]
MLLMIYARCVDGQLPELKRRLEATGNLPEAEAEAEAEVPGAGRSSTGRERRHAFDTATRENPVRAGRPWKPP